jgi:hypothetical protein
LELEKCALRVKDMKVKNRDLLHSILTFFTMISTYYNDEIKTVENWKRENKLLCMLDYKKCM